MKLSELENRIRTQLAFEYHDVERQEEEFQALTVPRLLEMLSYMDLEEDAV